MAVAAGAAAPGGRRRAAVHHRRARLTADRACQIQTWFGQRASWVLPVCTPGHNLEFSLGFIAVRTSESGPGHFEYVVRGKTLLRPLRPNGWGVGFVLGAERDPALAGTTPDVRSDCAYVPASRALAGNRVVRHANAGWLFQRASGGLLAAEASFGGYAFTWAARADVAIGRGERPLGVAVVEV